MPLCLYRLAGRSVLCCLFFLVASVSGSRPASAATLTVCASGCAYTDLQRAIDAAQPGDTILLRAGETFVGHFVLPAKANATGSYITIRSDAPTTALPAAGTRLVPFGHPGGNTSTAALARLRGLGDHWKTTPVLQTAPGAHHYRLQFLDIDGIGQVGWETLIEIGSNTAAQTTVAAAPSAIVLDRVFIHGHPTKGQKRCVSLNGRDVEVRDSYISGCASFVSDAQAIATFNGPGPTRIINNYLEASGENILFGGADPKISGLVPSDIEIRRNHIAKPVRWRQPVLQTPGITAASAAAGAGSLPAATHYFKVVAVIDSQSEVGVSVPSAERAVAASAGSAVNLSWTGVAGADRYRVYRGTAAGQENRYIETTGSATSFTYRGTGELTGTPRSEGTCWTIKNLLEFKNAQRVTIEGNIIENIWAAGQRGHAILLTPRNQEGTAPWSVVRDVTISGNVIRHAAGGLVILGTDDVAPSQPTTRITVRNNVFDDVRASWGGPSHLVVITRSPSDVTIDHNTILHDGMVVLVDDGASSGFVFTNNLLPHNEYGIFGSGAGSGSNAIRTYFPSAVVRRNAFAGGLASVYPPDNFFPDLATFMSQFVNAGAGDFRLIAGSAFRGAATDGKDLGADLAFLTAAQGGSTPPPTSGDSTGGTGGGTSGGTSSGGDIVLYAADVSKIVGNWARVSAASVAGGQKMQSADRGWSSTDVPRTAPADYFEATFTPEASRAYRVWLRLRAGADSKWNDSVWVQFSGAVDAGGAARWPIGSGSALLVNLETCSGCGVSGWGWQKNAWWLNDDAIVRFPGGTQTIRIQTREDGADIDQIVLSPVTYFNTAPGAARNDNTIVARTTTSTGGTAPPPPPSGSGTDIVLYPSNVTRIAGNWVRLSSTSGAGGQKMQSADRGWSSTAAAAAAPSDYFELPFTPETNRAYRVWVRLRAAVDSKWNDSVWLQFSGAVDSSGAPRWRVSSSSGLLVNLESCSGCGVAGWGWSRGAWWLSDDSIARFPEATAQILRIQTREDGVDVDQVILSPVTYFNASPGAARNDATIVPKP